MRKIHRIIIAIGLTNLIVCIIVSGCALMSFLYGQYTDSVNMAMWYLEHPEVAIPLWIATVIFAFSTSENLSFAEDFVDWAGKHIFKTT